MLSSFNPQNRSDLHQGLWCGRNVLNLSCPLNTHPVVYNLEPTRCPECLNFGVGVITRRLGQRTRASTHLLQQPLRRPAQARLHRLTKTHFLSSGTGPPSPAFTPVLYRVRKEKLQFYWVRKPSITTLKYTFFRSRPPLACGSFHFPREYRRPRSSHENLAESLLGVPRELAYWLFYFSLWLLTCFTVAFRLHLALSHNPYQSFHTLLSLLGC